MIQITATEVETNRRHATAYLSLVDRNAQGLDGWRLIWMEGGKQYKSKVVYKPLGTSKLSILVECYQIPDITGAAL